MANQKKSSYLTGAAILAATVAVTKVVGMVYKIPLYNLLGDEGTSHFSVMYNIYTFILTIATAGVPVALSRLISAARATNRPNQLRRYYNVGYAAFGLIGLLGAAFMIIFARPLAEFMKDPEVVPGIIALAPAVFFACLDAVLRGHSQGHNNMVPTAVSQIMEVMCKLVFGLAIAWYLSRRGYSLAIVAAGAIVGVTIGMGLSVPALTLMKRRYTARTPMPLINDKPMSRAATLRQLLSVAIPITLSSSVLNIINLLDASLVRGRLNTAAGFPLTDVNILYGVYSKGLTLFTVPSAFITPIAVAVVPVISGAVARRERESAKATMESSMKLTNLLAMPAAVGLAVLSGPIFDVLFPGSNENGPALLSMLGLASYFVCAYLITNGILQASGHEKLALIALPVGGLVKIAVNYVLVGNPAINITGAPIGTLVCYAVITALNIAFITVKMPERPDYLAITARPMACALIMGAAAWGVNGLADRFLLPALGGGRIAGALCLALTVVVAVAVYGALIIALKAVTREDVLLAPGGEKLARLLKLK